MAPRQEGHRSLLLAMLLVFWLLLAIHPMESAPISSGEINIRTCYQGGNVTSTDPTYWLQIATFHATCFYEFPKATAGDNECSTLLCLECISPCSFVWSTVGQCQAVCSTAACQRGCAIFSDVLANVTTAVSGDLAPGPLPSAPVKTLATNFGFQLSWESPLGNSTEPLAYVVLSSAQYTGGSQPYEALQIVTGRAMAVHSEALCKQFPFVIEPSLEFEFKVIAVNWYGWSVNLTDALESNASRPSFGDDGITNLILDLPAYYVMDDRPYVEVYVGWDDSPALQDVTGFLSIYKEISCPFTFVTGRFSKTEEHEKNITLTSVYIANNAQDRLAGCNITITLYPLRNCFVGNEASVFYLYPGCNTLLEVPPGICPNTTTPTTPCVSALVDPSVYQQIQVCPVDMEGDCDGCNCSVARYEYTVVWDKPVHSINGYTIRHGPVEVSGDVGAFIDYEELNVTTETYTMLSLKHDMNYGIEVVSRDSCKTIRDSFNAAIFLVFTAGESFRPTVPPTPLPTPSPRGSDGLSVGVIISIVLAIIVIITLIILFVLCRRQRKKQQSNAKYFGKVFEFQSTVKADKWELNPDNIVLGEALGEGAFGKVYLGTVKGALLPQAGSNEPSPAKGISIKAAVKMLQPSADHQQSFEFQEEIKLMKEVGYHKNIVSMLGCCTLSDPLFLVVEFMQYGDLLHFLRDRRRKGKGAPYFATSTTSVGQIYNSRNELVKASIDEKSEEASSTPNDPSDDDYLKPSDVIQPTEDDLTPEDLLSFSWQIASGMEFLTGKGFVHRDLAARNVLVGTNKCVKISDFGLSRLVYEERIYTGKRNRRLPLKWMSIEAIFDQVFTAKSDVWAFGVVLFEIATLGGTPYPSIDNKDLLPLLKTGYRMDKPENCSEEIYDVMKLCWNEDPDDRPTFANLRESFDRMLSEGESYIDFNFDEENPYYNVRSFSSIESDNSASKATEEGDDCKNASLKKSSTKHIDPETAPEGKSIAQSESTTPKQRYASPATMQKHQRPKPAVRPTGKPLNSPSV